jgi:glyoxylase-like metal-dependent hydrolase (beta-lactamase superfamily II)
VNRPRRILGHVEFFPVKTPTLPPATHTNVWALGEREVLIVDPAPESEKEQRALVAWIEGMRSEGRRPVAMVATHHHRDHIGALRILAKALRLPFWAHSETSIRLADISCDRFLFDGEKIQLEGSFPTWQVLHTPGHAPGHLCLYEPENRLLILGDMVAGKGTILIEPKDGNMRTYLEQLQRLARLEPRLGLPAHGDPIKNPSRLLLATHAHRLMRERKIIAIIRGQKGSWSAETILAPAYDDVSVAVWPLALLSLKAHLEKLVYDGVIVQREDGYARLDRGA